MLLSWVADYPVTSALFVVVLFCLLQAYVFKKDFFSPLTIYCFSQCITLAISYLQIDAHMSEFKPLTWMVWILGLAAFSTGCFVTRLVAKSRALPVSIAEPTPMRSYSWKLHLVLSFVVFVVFLAGVVKIIAVAGNLIAFTESPSRWMSREVDYGFFPILFSSGPLCVLLFGVAAFKKYNDITWIRRTAKIMVFVTIVVNLLAYPNRTSLFFNLGFLMILMNYLYKRISPIIILLAMIIAITTFVAISNLRNQYGSRDIENKAMTALIMLPYKYVANNYWNLDYALNPPVDREYHPHTYGIDFVSGIFEYLRFPASFKNTFHWDDPFNERIQKENGLNTVNYLWDVYKDFFLPGVLLFPLLCGIGLSVLHLKLCRPFTPRQILFYTYFIYFVGWWFFTSGYKQGMYCMWGVFLYLVTTICMKNEKREPLAPECLPADAPLEGEVECERDGKEDVAR
ncbi:O-antigen polymerase [Fibrobacter sp.]